MVEENPFIDCPTHGRERATLVCQHIAESLTSRECVGFWWSRDDDSEFPDAWCAICHERHEAAGLEWEGEALGQLGAKLLCATCYVEARALCLGE